MTAVGHVVAGSRSAAGWYLALVGGRIQPVDATPRICVSSGGVAYQAATENLLLRDPESADVGPKAIPFTVSIGVATREAGERDVDALMRRADRALYHAKAAGRNRVEVR
jgi:GGDEF domain-containing protein